MRIREVEIEEISPLRLGYMGQEYEVANVDKDQQMYIIDTVVYSNHEMPRDEVAKYIAAYLRSDDLSSDLKPLLRYTLQKNEDRDTYRFCLYEELTFHFSEYISNPVQYLQAEILDPMMVRQRVFTKDLKVFK